MATATKAAPATTTPATDAAVARATDTLVAALTNGAEFAGEVVTKTTHALTPVVQDSSAKAKELTDGFTAEVKKVVGLSVDGYQQAVQQQLDWTVELAEAANVAWFTELTKNNAKVVAEVVEVTTGAAHDLLK